MQNLGIFLSTLHTVSTTTPNMVIRLLKSVLVLCCCYEQAPLLPIEAAVTASKNDLASEPRSVPELIEYWDYPGETHWIKTADDYILAVHRIVATSETASEAASSSARPIAFLQHGLFGTSARWTLGPPDKVGKLCSVVSYVLFMIFILFVFFPPVFSVHSRR